MSLHRTYTWSYIGNSTLWRYGERERKREISKQQTKQQVKLCSVFVVAVCVCSFVYLLNAIQK